MLKTGDQWWNTAAEKLRSRDGRQEIATWLRRNAYHVADYLREPVMVFAAFYFVASAIAQPFYVPSGSMQPSLAIGDLLIATKYSYGYNRYSLPFAGGDTPKTRLFASLPQAGDVVVFRKPGDTATTLVKRVVGLPGDRVQMRAGHLWINGKELSLKAEGYGKVEDGPGEPSPGTYFTVARYTETLPNGREHPVFKKYWGTAYDETVEYHVPEGHLFVMGDNRDDSADSRADVGFLPVGNVMGRAQFVLASVDFVNASGIWAWPLQFRVKRLLSRIP
ncbi:signal peptidase I [Rhizomicrobium palustre]|uniref:Signal peptidase I n=1 Tax=Rhizomicrobium palustre TaxID=189966 RepID=A0A846N2X5_9PROT|nr:signal peptidase I [Rhizomicrobium palustre]NIK90086.1 signal peptidase I [Rhizomicrobium palustre]